MSFFFFFKYKLILKLKIKQETNFLKLIFCFNLDVYNIDLFCCILKQKQNKTSTNKNK